MISFGIGPDFSWLKTGYTPGFLSLSFMCPPLWLGHCLLTPIVEVEAFLNPTSEGPGSLSRLYAQTLEDTKIYRVPSPLGFSKNIGSQNSFRVHSPFFINETKNLRKEHQFSW